MITGKKKKFYLYLKAFICFWKTEKGKSKWSNIHLKTFLAVKSLCRHFKLYFLDYINFSYTIWCVWHHTIWQVKSNFTNGKQEKASIGFLNYRTLCVCVCAPHCLPASIFQNIVNKDSLFYLKLFCDIFVNHPTVSFAGKKIRNKKTCDYKIQHIFIYEEKTNSFLILIISKSFFKIFKSK
jgi:hypothetical protein